MWSLYAVQFDTGAIKVGTSSAMQTRMLQHAINARHYGVSISHIWRSVSVLEGFGPEREWLRRIWGDQRTNKKYGEYLEGRDFDEIVNMAPLPAFYSQADRLPRRNMGVQGNSGDVWLTAGEVRDALGIDTAKLSQMVARGELHKVRLAAYGFPRFRLDEVRKYLPTGGKP